MIDISRLPRDDEYPSMQTAGAVMTDLPSDIKTVTYYIGPDPQVANNMAAASLGQVAQIGLIRRELDRSVNRLAVMGGLQMDLLAGASQLVAPEVMSIEFAYYDGFQMLPQWDSTFMEGLPVAVEIRLTIASAAPDGDLPESNLANPLAGQVVNGRIIDEGLTYRLLVPLPTAEPYSPSEEEEIDPETGEPMQPSGGTMLP